MKRRSPVPAIRQAQPLREEKRVELEWPLEFGGRTHSAIVVRRLFPQELLDHVNAVLAATRGPEGEDAAPHLPMFFAEDGTPLPGDVLDNLDLDDADAVQDAMLAFLPEFLRPAYDARLRAAHG